ncbi:uncharacterized protein LOC123879657 isoform X3 [Maniola jurtina]|uniref:uncharacterized protein LOC123879657 isoform X3 n=1 Tax=Maniola jurtina TaxID=191418 RepID=UPI001E686F04|nr:uncharacterized protein LOC123879657 isoform X3 [Maniola jurtina]
MTSRGRHSMPQDWDPMKEDYDNTYDAQYPDDEVSGGVQLDHCKLYITNIPKAINEEGLRNAFAAYGNLVQVHLSKDPQKRYGLVSYESPSEAKLAMMKLNRTDPLNLNIHIAHKKNDSRQSQPREKRYNNNKNNNYGAETGGYRNDNSSYAYRNDNDSVSSRERTSLKLDHCANGGNFDVSFQDEDNAIGFEQGLVSEQDKDFEYQQLQLKMNYLKLQEEKLQCQEEKLQCQEALLLYKKKTTAPKPIASRCILPDGRIQVRNVHDRQRIGTLIINYHNRTDPDTTFSSAAGDSSLPTLQRYAAETCLWCGAPAKWYCARCCLAHYCSGPCQQWDWVKRHQAVCHNLARSNNRGAENDTEAAEAAALIPAPAPLRRPRSPTAAKKDFNEENDRPRKNFMPAGHTNFQQANQNQNTNKAHNRGPYTKNFKNQTPRRPRLDDSNAQEEEASWDTKVETKAVVEPTPATKLAVPKPAVPKPAVPKPVESVPSTSQTPVKNVPKPEVKNSPVKKGPEVTKVETVPEIKKVVAPVSVADATPVRKIVPKHYLAETLSIGDTVLVSVDARATDCRSQSSGYVCLSLHEKCEQEYQLICDEYSVDCEAAQDYKPSPGELFSYFNPEDGAYYRARCLNPTSAALIDNSRVVDLTPADKCKTIAPKYEVIIEFCCVLDAANVKIGDNLRCTLKSKSAVGFKVQVSNADTGASVGEGEVSRWKPLVEDPVPKPVPAVTIPEVPRPDLKNKSSVLLVEVTGLDRALVRPADIESRRKFDLVMQDVLQFGMKASPIKEPPQRGQVVIGKFSDGNCYRALCKRTNVNANKYQLEYIEFGNVEVNTRETIYACPQELDLSSSPTVVSVVNLQVSAASLTPAAIEYIAKLRDKETELLLTLPDGAKSAPSGSEANLSVAKNKESVNKMIDQMCKPDWKKIEEKGGDVIETQPLMVSDVEYVEMPSGACEIDILDVNTLRDGSVCGCKKMPGTDEALAALAKRMEEYCNSELGRAPYLPKAEELCIAQFPPDPQWYRAALCQQIDGPGGAMATVLYLDYGNVETVPVTVLRKMLPEFIRGHPVRAWHLDIRDFPNNPSDEMLAKAVLHMGIDEEGRGILNITRCVKTEQGICVVDAPQLLKAMGVA